MKKTLRIKPTKSAGAVQMVGGLVFAIIGLTVVIPMTSKDNGPVWFGLLWTGAAVVGAIVGAVNAFSDRGISAEEIVSDSEEVTPVRSTADRLLELEDLRQRKLISEEEYAQTRQRILEEH